MDFWNDIEEIDSLIDLGDVTEIFELVFSSSLVALLMGYSMLMKDISLVSKEIASKLEITEQLVERHLIARIEKITKLANFFMLEESYTEREWKEMVSLHYVNTTYKPQTCVIRVHFFRDAEDKHDSYLGFVNIRPLNEPSACLSLIYPNWKVLSNELKSLYNEDVYVMTYKRNVHVGGEELTIDTFPFFPQDGVVTICAHAAIVMVTKFVRKTLGFNLVKLSDIVGGYSLRTKLVSTEGIPVNRMIEIFNNAEIPVSNIRYGNYSKRNSDDFKEWMDSYIESKLPVILTVDSHVITIIGHTLGTGGRKRYLVYDDSGAFFRLKDMETSQGSGKSFVDLVYWEQINGYLKADDYMIVPEMEKVFVPFLNVKKNYERFIKNELVDKDKNQKISERFFIVDNSTLKSFLADSNKVTVLNEDKSEFEEMIKSNLPHYLWFCEIVVIEDGKELMFGVVADPTKHHKSFFSMFYNVRLQLHERMSLLAA